MKKLVCVTLIAASLALFENIHAADTYLDSMDAIGSSSPGGAISSSLSVTNYNVQGSGAFSWVVHHTTAQGSDYADLYIDFGAGNLKDFSNDTFSFVFQVQTSTNFFATFQLLDSTFKLAELVVPQSATFTTNNYTMANFGAAGGFDWSRIQIMRFRSVGDISGIAEDANYVVDDLRIVAIPEPGTAVFVGLGIMGLMAVARRKKQPVVPERR